MAQAPQKPSPPGSRTSQSSHGAAPLPPPNRPLTQPEPDDGRDEDDEKDGGKAKEPEALPKEQALALLKAGHRLRKKGDDPDKWVAICRHRGDLVIAYPLTEEAEEELGHEQLVLID